MNQRVKQWNFNKQKININNNNNIYNKLKICLVNICKLRKNKNKIFWKI